MNRKMCGLSERSSPSRGLYAQACSATDPHGTAGRAVGQRTGILSSTHRLLSSSFLGLPYRILNMNHKKELLRSLWEAASHIIASTYLVSLLDVPTTLLDAGLAAVVQEVVAGYKQVYDENRQKGCAPRIATFPLRPGHSEQQRLRGVALPSPSGSTAALAASASRP